MNLLNEYKNELENIYELEFVKNIIIFGSYSQNKQKPLSDLDVCIITNKNITKKQKQIILNYKDEKFDINIFKDLNLPIQFKILTKGEIYKTKIDLTQLKIKTTNNWFDFRYILNKIYKSKKLLPII